jgi:hypothetical protein
VGRARSMTLAEAERKQSYLSNASAINFRKYPNVSAAACSEHQQPIRAERITSLQNSE